jgi:hypothetical protein
MGNISKYACAVAFSANFSGYSQAPRPNTEENDSVTQRNEVECQKKKNKYRSWEFERFTREYAEIYQEEYEVAITIYFG